MKKLLPLLIFTVCLLLVYGQEVKPQVPAAAAPASPADKDKPKPIKDVLPDAKRIDGLFTFYRKKDKLYAEIKGSNHNTDYLIAMAVAKGSGQSVIGGMTLEYGNSRLWQFRKVNDTIQVVRRNIRFKADSGTPESKSVDVAYSDSILYSLPILATGDGGGDVIDLASIFMSDLPGLGIGFFDRSRSVWDEVKGFANNMEFRVAATYTGGSSRLGSGGGASPERGNIGVTLHYSISKLPATGYTSRIADQRIGYFTVSHKNFSRAAEDNHNIYYINRWNLQKADPSATLSPPKKPIVFWIEKTVPFKYRNAVREGILEWNKAFEKVGIVNAIEVRQQSDSDTWDAEDINYNTIRWITSNAGFAIGPSRSNPLTGEIIDADILFDAEFIDSWRTTFDYTIADTVPSSGDKNDGKPFARYREKLEAQQAAKEHQHHGDMSSCTCTYIQEKAAQFALASLALAAEGEEEEKKEEEKDKDKSEEAKADEKKDENKEEKKEEGKEEEKKKEEKKPSKQEKEKARAEKFEKLVQQGLKDVVMHEVGHTLGLRHNFEASSWLTLDEINDPNRSKEYGIAGSVMDYLPINLAPKGKPQGDYFMTTLGPYDYLAIEYGYKILSGGTDGEKKELEKTASRQAEKGNNFATDEDLMFNDSDPRTERRDLGPDPLTFAQRGLELYNQLLPEILDRSIREDGRYRDVGRFYTLLLNRRYKENLLLIRNVNGLYKNRDRKGDPGNRPPIQVIDAKTRRDAVRFICENTFGADSFKLAPEIYNQFGEEKWLNRDEQVARTTPISLGSRTSQIQCGTLSELTTPDVLAALSDMPFRVPDSEDIYTADELFSTLTASIFSELDAIKEGEFSGRKPAIPAVRRALQEFYFKVLAYYVTGDYQWNYFNPDISSCRAVSRTQLTVIDSKIQTLLTGKAALDAVSSSHLTALKDRIKKLLEANTVVDKP